jgi:xanthine dehydrogenase molybdopterin-binding subunit B
MVFSDEGSCDEVSSSSHESLVSENQLLPNDENYANVRGTKAVGEPPLLLGISVWTAIADALRSLPIYRENYPQIELPATQEVVLRAMEPTRFKFWSEGKAGKK